MNIWQVLQGKVQLPRGSAPPKQLQQNQQQELLQQPAAGKAPAALQLQQSSAGARLCSPQAVTPPGQLSNKDALPSYVGTTKQGAAAAVGAGTAAATLQTATAAASASESTARAAALLLCEAAEVAETNDAAGAAAAATNCVSCSATSAACVSTCSSSSSSNAVSVQLRVIQDSHVQLLLVLPCTATSKTAAALTQQSNIDAAGRHNLSIDVVPDTTHTAHEYQQAAAAQPTHYTPTVGEWWI